VLCFLFVAASSDQPTMSASTSDEATTTEPEANINLTSWPSISAVQPAELSSAYSDTLLQISPLPKAVTVPGACKRKSAGSELITRSPYKNTLLEKQPEKKRPKTSQKPAKTKQQAKSHKKQTSRKKYTVSKQKADEVVQTPDQSKKQCTRPTRVRKQCFTLAEVLRKIEADTDNDDSDVEQLLQ